MYQNHTRRRFLFWTIAGPAVLGGAARAAGSAPAGQDGQQQNSGDVKTPGQRTGPVGDPAGSSQNTMHLGDHTGNSNAAAGGPNAPEPDPKAVLKANAKDIKSDVARLSGLVDELKKQVDATDSTSVLSLAMVHKAEDIEKLAHHIATLARG